MCRFGSTDIFWFFISGVLWRGPSLLLHGPGVSGRSFDQVIKLGPHINEVIITVTNGSKWKKARQNHIWSPRPGVLIENSELPRSLFGLYSLCSGTGDMWTFMIHSHLLMNLSWNCLSERVVRQKNFFESDLLFSPTSQRERTNGVDARAFEECVTSLY